MSKAGKVLVLAILFYIAYLAFVGASSLIDYVAGAVAALVTSYLVADALVKESRKLGELRRLGSLIKYVIKYMLIIEPKAHADVIKRIISPSMPIKPGIVEVPYGVHSDYAILTIANSITNTPGTVTVDVDKERKSLYVHWIDVKAVEPEKCRELISKTFEEYARRVFD